MKREGIMMHISAIQVGSLEEDSIIIYNETWVTLFL